jgi:hypothetical protein
LPPLVGQALPPAIGGLIEGQPGKLPHGRFPGGQTSVTLCKH